MEKKIKYILRKTVSFCVGALLGGGGVLKMDVHIYLKRILKPKFQ